MKNRFTIPNFIIFLAFAVAIYICFWPFCSSGSCHALIWTSENVEDNAFPALLLGIMFLIPFFMCIHGIYMYTRGYGEPKFGQKGMYDKNPTVGRRKDLLYSSVAILFVNTLILYVLFWNLRVLLK